MLYYFLFGGSIFLLIVLTATAAYFVFQKKNDDLDNQPKIHRSGAFSIIHRSPHEGLLEKKLDEKKIEQALQLSQNKNLQTAKNYLDSWNLILEKSLAIIDQGDKEGLQTFCYDVPEKDFKTCSQFSGNVYVTREQLHNYPALIPPFHIGCQVTLKFKNAWNTNLDGTGWKALLPVKGKYETPDWRTVAES